LPNLPIEQFESTPKSLPIKNITIVIYYRDNAIGIVFFLGEIRDCRTTDSNTYPPVTFRIFFNPKDKLSSEAKN
jgi:hypothetical protein